MSHLEDLRKRREEITEQMSVIEQAVRQEENTKLIGKCFRYNDGFGKDTRWWMYMKVLEVVDGAPIALTFETDNHGKSAVEKCAEYLVGDSEEISENEFNLRWDQCMRHIKEMGQ